MRITALSVIATIFLFISCTGNKEKISVIKVVDTSEDTLAIEKYDSDKKLILDNKLKEFNIRSSFLDTLLSIDYGAFIGIPIGDLIKAFGKPKGYFYSGDPYGSLGSCYFKYSDSIQLRIAPDSLIYLKKYNSQSSPRLCFSQGAG